MNDFNLLSSTHMAGAGRLHLTDRPTTATEFCNAPPQWRPRASTPTW
jgi:hypothetical protein